MDAKQKKVLALLVCGSAILVWRVVAVVNKYVPSSANATQIVATPEATLATTQLAAIGGGYGIAWKQQENVAQQPWGRDPFSEVPGLRREPDPEPAVRDTSPSRTPAAPPQLRFTGVSRRGNQWMTLLDGKILRVGDRIDDSFEVVEIDKQSVTLGAGAWLYRYDLGVQEAVIRSRAEEP